MEDELILTTEPCDTAITTCETPHPLQTPNQCCDTVEETTVGANFALLSAVLQESILHAWRLHLKAKKYSVHVILEEYYKEALDIIDGLIEHYQGICKCDIITDDISLICVKNEDPFIYFTDLREYILSYVNNSYNFNEKTLEIKSDIDDLLRLIDSTLYKLGNLTESKIKSFDEFVCENFK